MTAYIYSEPIPLVLMSDMQRVQARIESHGARVAIEFGFPVDLRVAEQGQTEAPPPPLDHIWASNEEDGETPGWIAVQLSDSQMRSCSQPLWIELPSDVFDSTSLNISAESWKDAVTAPEAGSSSDEMKLGTIQNIGAPANEANVAIPEPPIPTSSKANLPTRLISKPLPALPLPSLPLANGISVSSVESPGTFYYLRQREEMRDFFIGRIPYSPPIHPIGTPLLTGPASPRACVANHRSGRIPYNTHYRRGGQIHRGASSFRAFTLGVGRDWVSAIGRVFSFRQEPQKKPNGHPGPFEIPTTDGKCMQKGCRTGQGNLIRKCGSCDLFVCNHCIVNKYCPGKG